MGFGDIKEVPKWWFECMYQCTTETGWQKQCNKWRDFISAVTFTSYNILRFQLFTVDFCLCVAVLGALCGNLHFYHHLEMEKFLLLSINCSFRKKKQIWAQINNKLEIHNSSDPATGCTFNQLIAYSWLTNHVNFKRSAEGGYFTTIWVNNFHSNSIDSCII